MTKDRLLYYMLDKKKKGILDTDYDFSCKKQWHYDIISW